MDFDRRIRASRSAPHPLRGSLSHDRRLNGDIHESASRSWPRGPRIRRPPCQDVAFLATIVAQMATNQFSDPATLLFGTYRRKVLGLLLLHPGEHFHLREIARITGTQPGTVRRELSLLASAGLIERAVQGNQVRFRANETYPIYDELRSILKKTAGVADQLRAALGPFTDRITIAFVYGSVASGQERVTSDIDLLIVGTVKFEDVVRVLHPCQEELRREINPHVYSPAEFKRKASEESSFLARVLKGPKLFVIGSDHELGKSGEDRKAEAT